MSLPKILVDYYGQEYILLRWYCPFIYTYRLFAYLPCLFSPLLHNNNYYSNFELDTLPVTLITVVSTKSKSSEIDIFWSNAVCAKKYRLNIRSESGLKQKYFTQNAQFIFTVRKRDHYNISVNSINYFGRNVGSPVSTKVCLACESTFYLLLMTFFVFVAYKFLLQKFMTEEGMMIVIEVSNSI